MYHDFWKNLNSFPPYIDQFNLRLYEKENTSVNDSLIKSLKCSSTKSLIRIIIFLIIVHLIK